MKRTRKNRFRKKAATRRLPVGSVRLTGRVVGFAILLVALSATFILAHDYFTQSAQFAVQKVTVSGNQRLSREQVLAVAGVQEAVNILSLNLATARKQLLADPWIAGATVSRQIPGALHLQIEEEQPLARLTLTDGQGFLVNRSGRIFKRSQSKDAASLPWIQGLEHGDLPVDGARPTRSFKAAMALLHLAERPDNPLSQKGIGSIRVDREIGISVVTRTTGQLIKFGFGHYDRKCAALGRLLAHLKKQNPMDRYPVIDLFDTQRIVIGRQATSAPHSDRKEV